jgi:hypothetical protein
VGVNGSSTSRATIAFRFTPVGTGSRWQVDDLYVDPYRRFQRPPGVRRRRVANAPAAARRAFVRDERRD